MIILVPRQGLKMKKVVRCDSCYSEWVDESFGITWNNEDLSEPMDLIINSCPACDNKDFTIFGEDICYKNSKCSGWKKSMDQLCDQQIFCSLHYAAPEYKGEKFRYCPWCGELITNKEDESSG